MDRRSARTGRVRWLRELALIAALYVGYSVARLIGDADFHSAVVHARDLLALERLLHIDIEAPANAALAAWTPLAVLASYWYSLLHYVVTPAVLVWAYRRHHGDYRRVRDALVLASAIGLVGFTLLPMAPPRMLPGFVDTLASTSQRGLVGRGRQRAARAGCPHQPAGRDAVAARRLGGLGAPGSSSRTAPGAGCGSWRWPTRSAPPWSSSPPPTTTSSTRWPVPPWSRSRSGCPAGSRCRRAGAVRPEPVDSEPVDSELLDGERVVGAGLGQRGRQ